MVIVSSAMQVSYVFSQFVILNLESAFQSKTELLERRQNKWCYFEVEVGKE